MDKELENEFREANEEILEEYKNRLISSWEQDVHTDIFGSGYSKMFTPIETRYYLEYQLKLLNAFIYGSKIGNYNIHHIKNLGMNIPVIRRDKDTLLSFELIPQKQIGDYFVDFCFFVLLGLNTYKVIIELDGHNYHDKTKEQASKDRERERWLVAQGFYVIRYTGSDVFKNTSSVIDDTINRIVDIIQNRDT